MAVMSSSSRRSAGQRLGAFFELCKPRVNSLIVFTAMIGMFLATPSFPPFALFVAASIGIALVAGAAAARRPRLTIQDCSERAGYRRSGVDKPAAAALC